MYENTAKLAQTGIGQNDVRATPLEMALVAAGVANGGRIMTPHVMKEIRARDGAVVKKYGESPWRDSMASDVASTMRGDMIGVVQNGSAKVMQLPGVEVGAKTGTAQLGSSPPKSHGWMIAFAGPPNGPSKVAVAVIVEGLDGNSEATGGSTAGPIAKAVIQAALAAP